MNLKKLILSEIEGKDWSELEVARYIYIRLGQLLVFDPLYVVGTSAIKNKLFYQAVDVENLESNKIVCSTWSKIYSELLNELGIEAYIAGNKHHEYVIVNIDGNEFRVDATEGTYSDLTRIKYGDETAYFRKMEGIEEFDQQINYKKQIYLKEVLIMLSKEIRDKDIIKEYLGIKDEMTANEKLKIKFEFIIELLNRSATEEKGYIDGINFIYTLADYLLTPYERETVKENDYYKINDDDCINLVIFEISLEEGNVYYCFAQHENESYTIEKIEKEKVLSYDNTFHSKNREFYL